AADVEHPRVVRRDEQRDGPLEAVLPSPGRAAVRTVRPGIDETPEAGLMVPPRQEARVVAAIGDVGLVGAGLDMARLARDVVPLVAVDPAGPAARPAHAGVVLLGAAHAVGEVIGRRDVVELRGGVVLVGPGLAPV